ncbi:hypothetical protein J7L36_00895 [bacterium]|nr:hypothetical protein [bacterium]
MSETKTVAEALIEQTMKIANALEELTKMGLPKDLIVLYIQKKTRLPKRDINAILEALQDFKKEVKIPVSSQ